MAIKILLIDDDSDDRLLFREAVYDVSPASICDTDVDVNRALTDLCDPAIQNPQIIFLDINMPKLNGWDCLEKIKANGNAKDIPVIMYSTSSHERDIERASRSGALGLLTKPDDYAELKRCLSELFRYVENNIPITLDTLILFHE
jgi:CheY-like chemotaxis protein